MRGGGGWDIDEGRRVGTGGEERVITEMRRGGGWEHR